MRRGEALAVRTLGRDGEELAYSDPRVPDAERAAAGLVTVAGRQRELDEGNRSRAAKRWGRGLAALPADANLVRVWAPRPLTELRRRLRGRRLAMWRDGAVLHVIWRGQALAAHLVGGIQLPLWLIDGSDLWELSVVVRGLDQAIVEIRVLPLQDDGWAWLGVALEEAACFRGPQAPPAPTRSSPLRGSFRTHRLNGAELGRRALTVYRPPGRHREPLPVVYLADGGSPLYAEVVEAAIAEGRLPALLLVGIANGGVEDGVDRRAEEYLLGQHRRRFAAHERFVLNEVLPWAETKLGARADRAGRVVSGCSNGAAWALAIAHRHPSRFGAVVALSMAGAPPELTSLRLRPNVRHSLVVGTLEQGRHLTGAWGAALRSAGAQVSCRERVAGHDMRLWIEELPTALAGVLEPAATLPSGDPRPSLSTTGGAGSR